MFISPNISFRKRILPSTLMSLNTSIVFAKGLHDFESHRRGKKGLLQEIFWRNKANLSSVMDVVPERNVKAFFGKGKDEKK